MAHRWSYEDDLACARAYFAFVMDTNRYKRIGEVIHNLSLRLPDISPGSIKMKLQNLKAVSIDRGFDDGLSIKPLDQYSLQTMRAHAQAWREIGKDI